jgi:hypothetical protein
MGDFSASAAIGAGFRLIGRHPLAFLAWVVTYIVICFSPQIGLAALILPAWSRMMQEIAAATAAGGTMPPARMMAAQAQMMQVQPLVWITSLAGHTLVLGAVYRAVLRPQDNRFFYLRLSGRELWLGLVTLVLMVMMGILIFAASLAAVIAGAVVAGVTHAGPASGLVAVPLMFAVTGGVIWVLLRLSLCLPMSFAAPGFRLYESWDLTRGHAGKMFAVGLAFVAMAVVTELAIVAAIFAVIGGFDGLQDLAAWFQKPRAPDFARLAPWIAFGGLVSSLFTTAFMTLVGAGWAEIYRDLVLEPAADAP